MFVLSIILGVAFIALLAILDHQASEVSDYLEEMKNLQKHE